MHNKQKEELRKRLNEIRQLLAPDKLPLVAAIERIAGDVRREFSQQKTSLQEAEAHARSLREMVDKQRLDHQTAKNAMLAEISRIKNTNRSIMAEQRKRESSGPKWIIGCLPFSEGIYITHLHSPRFLARAADDCNHIFEIIANNCAIFLEHPLDTALVHDKLMEIPHEQMIANMDWIDQQPSKDQAEELRRLAGQVLLLDVQIRGAESDTNENEGKPVANHNAQFH